MFWKLYAVSNGVIALAYFAVAFTILAGLVRTGQLRTNRLALATVAIFASCAAGRAYRLEDTLLPSIGLGDHSLRLAVDWNLAMLDLVTAFVAIWYWTLRSQLAAIRKGPAVFVDLKDRQRQALALNDDVVQGLAVTKYALDAGDYRAARMAVESTLASAQALVSDLLDEQVAGTGLGPGDLVRVRPAVVPGSALAERRQPLLPAGGLEHVVDLLDRGEGAGRRH